MHLQRGTAVAPAERPRRRSLGKRRPERQRGPEAWPRRDRRAASRALHRGTHARPSAAGIGAARSRRAAPRRSTRARRTPLLPPRRSAIAAAGRGRPPSAAHDPQPDQSAGERQDVVVEPLDGEPAPDQREQGAARQRGARRGSGPHAEGSTRQKRQRVPKTSTMRQGDRKSRNRTSPNIRRRWKSMFVFIAETRAPERRRPSPRGSGAVGERAQHLDRIEGGQAGVLPREVAKRPDPDQVGSAAHRLRKTPHSAGVRTHGFGAARRRSIHRVGHWAVNPDPAPAHRRTPASRRPRQIARRGYGGQIARSRG